jgi:hypothetical protein
LSSLILSLGFRATPSLGAGIISELFHFCPAGY